MEAGSEARVRLDILSIAKRGGWPKIPSGILYNLPNQGCSEATQAGELVRTGHLQLAETGPVISTSKRLRQLMKTSVKQLTTAFIMATGFCLCRPCIEPVSAENPHGYLSEYCEPYYPGTTFPKLTTPQWVGETGVDAVITLAIDDMRDPALYEAYLRPILERLKITQGRAPVSIMTCTVNPDDPQLQRWIKEGLSLEVHTVDHPCPCLQGDQFETAKSTYDRCVDLMASIRGNKPVAFRTPCCDSRNTPSPRLWSEIFNSRTPAGNYLQADSSVFNVFTSRDPELPKHLVTDSDGKPRMKKYIPFPSFVNTIENYPYPYVIGGLCWQFPCMVPSDWEAQNLHQPNNPITVADMKSALDATVIKKGMFNLVFHPHGWIRNDQIIELIDYAHDKYGKRVQFLSFKDCMDRINKNLLVDQPLRSPGNGEDNGVRIADVNNDGFLDVLIGNENRKTMRVWQPVKQEWRSADHEVTFTSADGQKRINHGAQIGKLTPKSTLSILINHDQDKATYEYSDGRLERKPLPNSLMNIATSIGGVDQGVRLRDIDNDGKTEIIIANEKQQVVMRTNQQGEWFNAGTFPAPLVTAAGGDNGVRFVDLDEDGNEDVIFSNGKISGIQLFDTKTGLYSRTVEDVSNLPLIARNGTNNGAWFARQHMWVQNENTNRLPDGVDRRSFQQLLGKTEPGPRTPERSLGSIEVQPGFKVELVAAEPLVMDPVAIDWGPDGKLWVVEMADYPLGMDDRGKPGGRVRYLEDTDGDGKYDSSTLFLDNIPYPTGVMAWRDGVIVSAAPSIFFAADRDQDGRAEIVEDLYRGFAEGNQQHRVNGFERGLDNWIYLANGDSGGNVESLRTGKRVNLGGQDLRIRPDTGEIDLQTGRTQFGRHRDDHGNWFGCSNPLPVRHFVLADHYMRRNPFVAAPTPRRDIARVDNTQLYPISRVRSHWSGYRPPAAGVGHKFTSACSTMIYRDSLLGHDYLGDTFTCAPVHNLVHRRKLIADGVSFQSERPAENSDREFLASTDSWFRPATVTTGPDGALWIVDMYRLVIEHPEWIDDQREKELFLRAGHDRGRIYRVFPTDTSPRPTINLKTLDSSSVADLLSSSNGRVRDLAQQELVTRRDSAVTDKLRHLTVHSESEMGRLHALCALSGITLPAPDLLVAALGDTSATVRRHAIRLSEQHISSQDSPARELLQKLEHCSNDGSPLVLMQLAYSLGAASGDRGVAGLAAVAMHTQDAPYLKAAIVSSLNRDNLPAFYAAISAHPDIAQSFRPTILEMASRMKNIKFLSHVVSQLLERLESAPPSVASLRSLTSILTVMAGQDNELPPRIQKRIDKMLTQALVTASNREASINLRIAAIELSSHNVDSLETLFELLSNTEPTEVQTATTTILAPTHPQKLLQRFNAMSPRVRTAAVDSLLSRKSTTRDLLSAIKKDVIPLNSLSLVHQQRLTNHVDGELQADAKKLFASPPTSEERTQLISRYQASMSNTGDIRSGKQIFKQHCSTCHHFKGIGNKVGPDLTALKNRSANALVTAILDPGAAVEDKYLSYSVLTFDGVVHAGIIAGETSTSLEILLADGKTKTIVRSDIERLQTTGQSLMPEGMEKNITPEQMNHLLAFLNDGSGDTEKTPLSRHPGNTPVTVKPDANGTLHLTAATSQMHGEQFRFEPTYGNIGFWNQSDEYVSWLIELPASGNYEVLVDYACPDAAAENTCRLNYSSQTLRATVASTGSWDEYRKINIGTVELTKGESSIRFGADAEITGWLMDLRTITLRPTK